ncbi:MULTISPECIES: integrase arm-type DNA-binding domain-containing protein [unclassified Methylomonas]|uniref:tyrosine-type recombinase/integrase n=1 Tax=unclassified Methylomonas TaxID=2608980 RepID=UPI00068F5D3C|nr:MULTISPECIES: integrase arm-type DNA-binding domain-containing protein [unclassified Methylomonas]
MVEKLNTDKTYRAAKPKDKDHTVNDGGGLTLLVKTNGSKLWRFIYRFDRKQNRLSFGVYPEVSLEQARRKAEEARSQIANGIDPSETRKQAKIERQQAADNQKRIEAGIPIVNSCEHVCREWPARTDHTVQAITQQKKIRRFELYVFPVIGGKPIAEIKSPDIFGIIKPLSGKNQLETAHRINSEISAAFSYAIAHGFTDYDPAQPVAKQIPAQKVKHNAAVTEPKEVAQLRLAGIYPAAHRCVSVQPGRLPVHVGWHHPEGAENLGIRKRRDERPRL